MDPLIETERLRLRLPEARDVPEIADFYARNRAHLAPWEPSFQPERFLPAHWHDQVERLRAEWEAGVSARFFLFARAKPRQVIGSLSLTQISRGPAQQCVLGYSLDAAAEGRGYMTEAVRAAVGFAFGELGLHRVTAGYMPHNRRSAAVLRRCGFAVEGYARDYLLIDGRWEDHILTAVCNPGWRDRAGPGTRGS